MSLAPGVRPTQEHGTAPFRERPGLATVLQDIGQRETALDEGIEVIFSGVQRRRTIPGHVREADEQAGSHIGFEQGEQIQIPAQVDAMWPEDVTVASPESSLTYPLADPYARLRHHADLRVRLEGVNIAGGRHKVIHPARLAPGPRGPEVAAQQNTPETRGRSGVGPAGTLAAQGQPDTKPRPVSSGEERRGEARPASPGGAPSGDGPGGDGEA